MRRETVLQRDVLRRALIGAGLVMAVNAAGCGESSVLSSFPDGGPGSTGTGGSIGTGGGGDSGSGGHVSGGGGSSGTGGGKVGSGGSSGSGGYPADPGDWGTGGAAVVSPGWREGRMVGRWQGDNDALRITQCSGLMPTSAPFQLSITASPVDGTLAGVDSEGCSWRIRVVESTASVAPGSTCRRVRGSDVLLFTVNELSLSSVSAWAGTVSGALTLTVTGPAGTQGCMVSMKGPVTKEP